MQGIKLNTEGLKYYLAKKGINAVQLSKGMGRSDNFVSNCIYSGAISQASYRHLCLILGVPEDTFVLKEEPAKEEYSINMTLGDGKVGLQLLLGDKKISSAWALCRGESDKDLLQAVSYAAHMMYKLKQQEELNG